MFSLLEEDQSESSAWLEGTVHTALKNYNEFVLLQGLSERPFEQGSQKQWTLCIN